MSKHGKEHIREITIPGRAALVGQQPSGPSPEQKVGIELQKVEVALRAAMLYQVHPQILLNILEETIGKIEHETGARIVEKEKNQDE